MEGVHADVVLMGMIRKPAAVPCATAAAVAFAGRVGDMGPSMAKKVIFAGAAGVPYQRCVAFFINASQAAVNLLSNWGLSPPSKS